jgi:glutamyl-tRNA synthetase
MTSAPSVVTRFAPSPTGQLHIGGARTALFNWLYARHTGGKFVIRIEDTDKERSTQANVQVIFDGLDWLGLKSDAPVVYQASRADRHREVVETLLASGQAYRCYMTVEELAEEREIARAQGRPVRSPWRDAPPPEGDNRSFVLRLRSPMDGETRVDDQIKGMVAFANRDLDDLILLRADGAPTYNLAVVVDDHDMGVTHVIRGDDHLNNAARQTQIYLAMGWQVPAFAHLPLIHGPDGAKLSKRHGAQAVGEFETMGYLPEAMRNYLARLGWGHGDDELFSDEQAIAWFDVIDVVKAPARLDWAKLGHINNHYIRLADIGRLTDLVLAHRQVENLQRTADSETERLATAIERVREGAQTVPALADLVAFALLSRPLALDAKVQGLLTPETRDRLTRLTGRFKTMTDWSLTELDAVVRSFATDEGVGIGKFGPALRGVMSGGAPAPDLASTLFILGQTEALGRLEDALSPIA